MVTLEKWTSVFDSFFKQNKKKKNNGRCFGQKCEDMFYQYTVQVAVEEDNHVVTAAFTLNTCLRN